MHFGEKQAKSIKVIAKQSNKKVKQVSVVYSTKPVTASVSSSVEDNVLVVV